MNAKKLAIQALVAYRVLRDSFVNGVALSSQSDLEAFRNATLSSLPAPTPLDDARLAALLFHVGFLSDGRVFPPKAYSRVLDAARATPNQEFASPIERRVTSDVCKKLFFLRSLFPLSAIAYPDEILRRHEVELALFGVHDVASLTALTLRLGFFRFLSRDGRYYANDERPEEELVMTTLRLSARDYLRRDDGADKASIPLARLLDGVYVPPAIARRVLNAEGSPFLRGQADLYALVDDDAPTSTSQLAPCDPGSFASDHSVQVALLAQATALGVPCDVALFHELAALPLRFKRASAPQDVAPSLGDPCPPSVAAARAELGELVDSLFAQQHLVLYYRTLYERHAALFHAAGIDEKDDITAINSALQTLRPQYCHNLSYMTASQTVFSEFNLVKHQLLLRWGASKKTTFEKLLQNVYLPSRLLKKILGLFPDFFADEGDGSFVNTFHDHAKFSEKETAQTLVDFLATTRRVVVYYDCVFETFSEKLVQAGIVNAAALKEACVTHCGATIQDHGDYMFTHDPDAIHQELLKLFGERPINHSASFFQKDDGDRHDELLLFSLLRAELDEVKSKSKSKLKAKDARRLFLDGASRHEARRNVKKYCMYCTEATLARKAFAPLEVVHRLLNEQNGVFIRHDDDPNYWSSLLTPSATSNDKEAQDDVAENANEEERDVALATLEPVGALLDELFANDHVLLYYSKLWERHERIFRDANLGDASRLRDAIRTIRPQYDARESYVQLDKSVGAFAMEATKRQLELRWGDASVTTLQKLANDLYVPSAKLQTTLKNSPSFLSLNSAGYAPNSYRLSEFERKSAAKATRKKRTQVEQKEASPAETTPAETAPVETAPVETAPVETAPVETTAAKASPAKESRAPNLDDEKNRGTAETTDALPQTRQNDRTTTPEEQLATFVEKLRKSRQTIVYYRAVLENDKTLAALFSDEDALRDALRAQFPKFGFQETFFEPRRRSTNESEDLKIRRSLLLGWRDDRRFDLQQLEKKFFVSAIQLERVLNDAPNYFKAEGRKRFSVTPEAQKEAARLIEAHERIADDLKNTLEPDDSLLFYEPYFDQNREWLEELGVDKFELLRREMDNINDERKLGYLFYKKFCERKPSKIAFRQRVDAMIRRNWGESTNMNVNQLLSRISVPKEEILSILNASPDFVFLGAETFRLQKSNDDARQSKEE